MLVRGNRVGLRWVDGYWVKQACGGGEASYPSDREMPPDIHPDLRTYSLKKPDPASSNFSRSSCTCQSIRSNRSWSPSLSRFNLVRVLR
jgi:hypothetical protein